MTCSGGDSGDKCKKKGSGGCDYKLNYGKDPRFKQDDIRTFLVPPPSNVRPNPTSLYELCTCSGLKNIKRYQCLPCIRSYIWAVPYEITEQVIRELRDLKQEKAVERVTLELNEKKRKEL